MVNILLLRDSIDEADIFKIYFDMGYRETSPEALNKNYNYDYQIKK